jgi:hypothetical protein
VRVATVLCLLLAAKSVATVLCSCLLLLDQSRLFYAILCYRFHRKLFLEPRNRFRFLSELDAHASDWTLKHERMRSCERSCAFRLPLCLCGACLAVCVCLVVSCLVTACRVLSCLVSSRLVCRVGQGGLGRAARPRGGEQLKGAGD